MRFRPYAHDKEHAIDSTVTLLTFVQYGLWTVPVNACVLLIGLIA